MATRLLKSTTLFACLAFALFAVRAADELKHGPDSEIHEGVPRGKVEQQPKWLSKTFPGTERDWWIYIPAQYKEGTPANVMIFQDGGGPVSEKGEMRAPIVLDNLIHKKEMPVTIGIFINPGVLPSTDMSLVEIDVPGKDGAPSKKEKRPVKQPRQNRAFEYDSVGDRYARFLIDEILPEVSKRYTLTQDPAGRALVGQSSGGSCAFTAAWERPDMFGKVVSGIGSFTSLHGCNMYPDLIRKMEPKPLRIYMQDGDKDLDIYAGSWWQANNDMAAALRFMGYDYFFLQGHDGHSGKQLGVNFPDVMRWLWRNEPVGGKRPEKVDPRGVHEVLVKDEGWKRIAELPGAFFRGGDVDDSGAYYVLNAVPNSAGIKKLGADGKLNDFAAIADFSGEIKFGPDGKLYAAAGKKVVSFAPDATRTDYVELPANNPIISLSIDHVGNMYCGADKGVVTLVNAKKEIKDLVPMGDRTTMILTPDQGFMAFIDQRIANIFSFRVEKDGTLTNAEPFYTLQTREGQISSVANASAVDDKGRLYVTSLLGVQIFDQGGRVIGILTLPDRLLLSGMAFGGPNFDTLYVTTKNAIYARKLNAKGVRSCKPPIVVPGPRM
ncbi:MAG: SMP-30/gluconolactonase/LRE family protein [Planctomycetota bacterium]